MKHTALYLRVSTEAQADEGYSLAAQAEKLEAYCRMKGITRFRRYVDGGFSGSNLTRRPLPSWWRKSAPARSSASLSTSLTA